MRSQSLEELGYLAKDLVDIGLGRTDMKVWHSILKLLQIVDGLAEIVFLLRLRLLEQNRINHCFITAKDLQCTSASQKCQEMDGGLGPHYARETHLVVSPLTNLLPPYTSLRLHGYDCLSIVI